MGLRTGSYGSLQQQYFTQNGLLQTQPNSIIVRKPSKMSLSGSREKERLLPFICRYISRKKVGMVILVAFALLAFISGFSTVNKDAPGSAGLETSQGIPSMKSYERKASSYTFSSSFFGKEENEKENSSSILIKQSGSLTPYTTKLVTADSVTPLSHHCNNFAFPPPPPPNRRRIGPRPCPVCYIPVEQALASMPKSLSVSPVLHNLSYVYEENPIKTETHGGSEFGGYPTLKQRNDSFNIKKSMTVHCGFVKGTKPGHKTGFDIDEDDLLELEQFHDVIVASAIFGNYDIIQQPKNISEAAMKNVPFYMFIDEETEAFMKNSSVLDSSKRIGLWRIVVVHDIPYSDARRNGKIPKLLLHRIFPNVKYSIWIDGKLQLVVDPYQVMERFLWRQNTSFAISRHYKRFDVFEEAEANKAAGKYDNSSIDYQIEFYKQEGLTPYSEAKLPITSDVPEGCVIIREHIPITNLFTCLWFNEVDRFTARDQLSFSTVRDKIMSKVSWSVNMFLDCERRNFVIQAYHRDLLEQMAPPAKIFPPPPPALPNEPTGKSKPFLLNTNTALKIPVKKTSASRRREKRASSRRHRKVVAGNRDKNLD